MFYARILDSIGKVIFIWLGFHHIAVKAPELSLGLWESPGGEDDNHDSEAMNPAADSSLHAIIPYSSATHPPPPPSVTRPAL